MDDACVLRRAIDAAQHLSDPEPPWQDLLEGMRQVVGGDSASFIQVDATGALLDLQQIRIDPAAERDYVEHFFAHDIVTPATLGAPEGSWFDTQEHFTPAALSNSAYYVDFMLRHRMPRMLTHMLEQGSLRRGALSVQRSSTGPPARKLLESAPLRSLTDAVREALDRRRVIAARWMHTVETTLNALGEAICLVSRQGTVIELSAAAQLWLEQGSALRIHRKALWHPLGAFRHSLRDALAGVAATGVPTQLMAPGGPNHRALMIDVVQASPALRLAGETLLLLRMRLVGSAVEARAEALCAAFDLTPAEGRVLAALANGETAATHADAHGVSVHTVRKQIAVLRVKMGFTRQVDMIRAALAAS